MAASGGQRLTIADVAELAGVSVPTVSKVLNGRHGVAPETRTRVQELLDAHGYRRRGTQRRQRVGLIDFVVRDLATPWATELVAGAEQEAARAGVGLVVTSAHGRQMGNRHWIQQLATRRTDGIVLVVSELMPGAEDELRLLNIPLVLVDPVGAASSAQPVVAATNWAGGRSAVDHLLALGHTRIGVVTGPAEVACARDRLDGYRAGLLRAGLTPCEELVRSSPFEVDGGRTAARSLLDLPEPPTAIVAGSDQQAYGVYQAARERGLTIPDDLSVVGFDDVAMCEWLSPPLTTVRQPLMDMAREATRIVLTLGRSESVPAPHVELATRLVVRASTAPPRAR
ncbi:LacI family DNA-binding transcriptional regulator [Actinotalea sp.]|uniref:LacI family DNA-binding transcriptional regulator n=1 Tax=Actinotalea sp. TaxID=1872145 RepID=UPI003566B120